MKKLTIILLFVGFVFLCGCSTITYYANGKSGMPCPDIPVIEPYTDIGSFKTRYFEREHDDSLTLRAHDVIMGILAEKGETWQLGDVLMPADTSEYEAIRRDVYDLLDSFGKKKHHDEARIWPTDKKKMASASLPPSLLEYMKRKDKPYVLILFQNGFEYIKDDDAGLRAHLNKGYEIESISNGDYYSELDCLVADALQNRVYFYSGDARGWKPTEKEVVEEGMHNLMTDYIEKNSITKEGLPKTYLSLFAGYGQVYPSAFATDGRDVGPTNISWGMDMMWSITNTPLSLGLSVIVNDHAITGGDEQGRTREQLTYVYSPMIGWNRIVANRHLFSLGLGMGLARSSVRGERKRNYLAENAVLSYGYRIDNNRVVGLKAHAYTFNDRFVQNDLPKPLVPMWDVSLCYTFVSF